MSDLAIVYRYTVASLLHYEPTLCRDPLSTWVLGRMRVVFEGQWRVLWGYQTDTAVLEIAVLVPVGETEFREALILTGGEEKWVELRLLCCLRHHYKEKDYQHTNSSLGIKAKRKTMSRIRTTSL